MRELHSLYELGALTESEFKEQKEPILSQLKSSPLPSWTCIIIEMSYNEPMVVIQMSSCHYMYPQCRIYTQYSFLQIKSIGDLQSLVNCVHECMMLL